MKEKNTAHGETIHEVLGQNGMTIAGWEPVSCGFGIEFNMPVIVKTETGERIVPAE